MQPWYRRPSSRRLLAQLAKEREARRLAQDAGISVAEAEAARKEGRRFCCRHRIWRTAENCCHCLRERRQARRRKLADS